MRPINLVPVEQRAALGRDARSSPVPAAAVGLLALAVLLVGAWALLRHDAARTREETAATQQRSVAKQRQADALGHYVAVRDLRRTREKDARQLARARVDWARATRRIASTVASGVRIDDLLASNGGTEAGSGSAAGSPAAAAGPNVVLKACARSQRLSAETLDGLRDLREVQSVTLASSKTAESEGGQECADVALEARITLVAPGVAPTVEAQGDPGRGARRAARTRTPGAAGAATPPGGVPPATNASPTTGAAGAEAR